MSPSEDWKNKSEKWERGENEDIEKSPCEGQSFEGTHNDTI